MHKIKQAKQVKRLIVLLALAFTLALAPAVPAQAKKPLKCEISIVLDLDLFQWNGIITGDIEGTFISTPDPDPSFPGSTEHFLETMVIEPTVGGEIRLYQEGVWNFKTGKFRANGMVIAASGGWEYLIGCNVHVRGVTTLPIQHGMTGEGTLLMSGFR